MPAVIITGGSGLIGKNLTAHLTLKGYEVVILSRKPVDGSLPAGVSYSLWNAEKGEIDYEVIARADYIVNLAGAGVMDKRWTSSYKKMIVASRVKSSSLLVEALQKTNNKVKAVISVSAIGWYGADNKKPQSTWKGFIETDAADPGFLGETCKLWEQSIEPLTALGKRLVKLRMGIVLSNDGGAFLEFKQPLRFGIAGILGNGKQVLSWIHIDDVSRMFIHAIENEQIHGTYNATAPQPVSNKQLVIKTADILRKNFYIPVHVPNFFLQMILGQRSIEILKSATVNDDKIKQAGFTFLYPSIDAALGELLGK